MIKQWKQVLPRLLAAFVLIAAAMLYLAQSTPDTGAWSYKYGDAVTPSPGLRPDRAIGQPFFLEGLFLNYIEVIPATYTRQPRGRLVISLLRGDDPPQNGAEAAARTIQTWHKPESSLEDSKTIRLKTPPLLTTGPGDRYYLLIQRPEIDPKNPVSLWTDWYPAAHLAPAQRLDLTDRGEFKVIPLKGHLSISYGYDGRPTALDMLRQAPWLRTGAGVFLLSILLWAVCPWPRAGFGFGRVAWVGPALGLAAGLGLGSVQAWRAVQAQGYLEYGLHRLAAGTVDRIIGPVIVYHLALVVAAMAALWMSGRLAERIARRRPGLAGFIHPHLPLALLSGGYVIGIYRLWGGGPLNPDLPYFIWIAAAWLLAGAALLCLPVWGRWVKALLVCVLVLAVALPAGLRLGLVWDESRHIPKGPNVVFIGVDTLRADHMSSFGNPNPTTPHLDKFGRESIFFTNAVSAAPWTAPSFGSMITGRYPINLGFRANFIPMLSPRLVTLAEVFKEAGYYTKGIISNDLLRREVGFAQGYDSYEFNPNMPVSDWDADRAIAFLDQIGPKPFFLFLHFQDPHYPWYLHPEYNFTPNYKGPNYSGKYVAELRDLIPTMTKDQLRALKGLYDSDIRFTDHHINRVLTRLKDLGLYDNTLIVFTADHGEEFYERRDFEPWLGHAKKVFQEYVHVPLIIKPVGKFQPERVDQAVQLLDLTPTILKQAGLTMPPGYRLDALDQDLTATTRLAQAQIISQTKNNADCIALIYRGLKLINYPRLKKKSLFYLVDDPGEKNDLAAREPEAVKELSIILDGWRKYITELKQTETGQAAFEAEGVRRLKDLGYM